jgi:hypothetical protein
MLIFGLMMIRSSGQAWCTEGGMDDRPFAVQRRVGR